MSFSSQKTVSPLKRTHTLRSTESPVSVVIPGSKSHSIRALILASLCRGNTKIYNFLYSGDTESCIRLVKNWGVSVEKKEDFILVQSHGLSSLKPKTRVVDLQNSGTSLFFALSITSLMRETLTLTGDNSLQSRSAQPLLDTLQKLGAVITSAPRGCPPITISGPIHVHTNQDIHIECPTSQYLSALLFALSCLKAPPYFVHPKLVGEFPYVDMSIEWLTKYGAVIDNHNYTTLTVKKGISLDKPTQVEITHINGDYSSASFFFVAAAITGKTLHIKNLEPQDTQADAKILPILQTMGCSYTWEKHDDSQVLVISGPKTLKGGSFDLSHIPDSLPILAVAASYASEDVLLHNVAHAREKESDRIAVMVQELSRLGVALKEREDGLLIYGSKSYLEGGKVNSHGDHRIAMSFAIAALAARGDICIEGAQSVSVTFPNFFEILQTLY